MGWWLLITEWFFFDLLRLPAEKHFAHVITYFFYDATKLLFLLALMIFVMSLLRTYIPMHRVKTFLEGKHALLGHTVGAGFGMITPFCSCSSIPIFIGLIKGKLPLGAAMSFLITSPLVNEYVVALMLVLWGWKITAVYVFVGFLIGVIGGMILGKKKNEAHLEKDLFTDNYLEKTQHKLNFNSRISFAHKEVKDIIKKLWYWVLLGVFIGALIHNLVPDQLIINTVSAVGIFGVLIAVILGVPLYGNSVAILPVAAALLEKGLPLGTALALLMSTVALSFPEAVLLRKVMNIKLIGKFFGIVALGILIIGYVLNMFGHFLL